MMDEEREPPSPPRSSPVRQSPPQTSEGAAFVTEFRVTRSSGPVPLPQILAAYNAAVPNGADRVLTLAEQEAEHRHFMDRAAMHAQTRMSMIGMGIAGGSILLFAVIAIGCLATGREMVGVAALLVPLSYLVASILGTLRQRPTADAEHEAREDASSSERKR